MNEHADTQSFTIILRRSDSLAPKKRVYARPYKTYAVVITQGIVTISTNTKEKLFLPLLFDDENILCFTSEREAESFINFLTIQHQSGHCASSAFAVLSDVKAFVAGIVARMRKETR
jgi:hypothetical protein